MKSVFILFSLSFSAHLFAADIDSVRLENRADGLYVIHRVDAQETLYSIARRYGGQVSEIIQKNDIIGNRIDIGQVLAVPISVDKREAAAPVELDTASQNQLAGYHRVEKGETLYSISKKYDLRIADLSKWNELSGSEISIGSLLRVQAPSVSDTLSASSILAYEQKVMDTTQGDSAKYDLEVDTLAAYKSYLVQTGETLYTIAEKIQVPADSLKYWNRLETNYLSIGQKIYFKQPGGITAGTISAITSSKSKIDENGFELTLEEGIAGIIESMKTRRYLALHRSLPIGTQIEVRNLMNNQVVHVKVIGLLPDTGINQNLTLRLSRPAYDQLGILDSRARVEISYHKR